MSLKVESTTGPKCPVCGHQGRDDDYVYAQAGDSPEDWECSKCGAVCEVTCETYTSFDYTTKTVTGVQP